jgi:two-component system chemotaxis sensor kinase CheA
MLDMFVFETNQMLEQLEEIMLQAEKQDSLESRNINEIFRIMHTIKGSAGMMMFSPIASLAHAVEDLFFLIREKPELPVKYDVVCELVLQSADAIKALVSQIEENEPLPETGHEALKEQLQVLLTQLRGQEECAAPVAVPGDGKKQFYISQYGQKAQAAGPVYHAVVRFDEGCEMENVRAYSLVFSLQEQCGELHHLPQDLIADETATARIVADGLQLWFTCDLPREEVLACVNQALFVKECMLEETDAFPEMFQPGVPAAAPETLVRSKPVIMMPSLSPEALHEEETVDGLEGADGGAAFALSEDRARVSRSAKGSLISVNIQKLDKLMDLVGEIVITESMVTRCPELEGLQLDTFHKSATQLRKLTDELQDIVMSIRMLPIAQTFQKMNRIVRDMGRRLGKEANLVILGEETEVDKNLIDQLADPLMHLVRNAMDHGLETVEERRASGKTEKGTIVLEARNEGGEVWIHVRDDGKGLDRAGILRKARQHGLTDKSDEELGDREVFGFVLLPGFSTKENVSEFSGRGVGMDVVRENITAMGGSITIESQAGQGTNMIIRIPLTLAIIDGMLVAVGENSYIIPTMNIRESLRANPTQIIRDSDGNGLLKMWTQGAETFGQDAASSVVYGMPMEAWKRGAVARQVPLGGMADLIMDALGVDA